MLPVELWKHIALQYTIDGYPSPKVYTLLSLVSRMFVMSTPMLQEYYLRKYAWFDEIVYKLPNGDLHSPGCGGLPAVIHADGGKYWYVRDKQHRGNDMPATIHTQAVIRLGTFMINDIVITICQP